METFDKTFSSLSLFVIRTLRSTKCYIGQESFFRIVGVGEDSPLDPSLSEIYLLSLWDTAIALRAAAF